MSRNAFDSNSTQSIVRGQRVEESKIARAKELRRAMTFAETMLWSHLRRNSLNGLHFRRQQIIQGFIADFYCHAASLVVECDGSVHDADYDRERDAIFASRGILVMRFSNTRTLNDLESVLLQISATARQRMSR